MKRTKFLCVAAALMMSGAAHAAGITYDCDTAAGHFSDLVLPAPAVPFTITGDLRVNQIESDGKWAPLARLRIGSAEPAPGAAPDDFAGIELTAFPGKALSMPLDKVQAFGFDMKGHDIDMIATSIGATGAAQPFRISYDGQSVTATVAGQTRTYPMKSSAPVVEVICSTGEFLFTNLTIESPK